jgi:hypothetical protein
VTANVRHAGYRCPDTALLQTTIDPKLKGFTVTRISPLRSFARRQRHTYRIDPPQRPHHLCGLARIDYTDAFCADTTIERSADSWARAVFEGPRPPLPAVLHFLWSRGVSLDLTSRSDRDRILGWRLATTTSDAVVLASDAPGMQVRLIALVEPGTVSWTTTIEYKTCYGRAIFSILGGFHRAMAKYLLARASRL